MMGIMRLMSPARTALSSIQSGSRHFGRPTKTRLLDRQIIFRMVSIAGTATQSADNASFRT